MAPAQATQYREQGYLVVPGVLSPAEVEAFLAHEKAPKPPEVQALGLRKHTADAQWRRLAVHGRVTGTVRELLKGDPMVVQTMYLDKAPQGGTGIALHQDSHYIRNEPNTLIACWLALSDADAGNGGLCVAPGSHLGPLYQTQPPRDTGQHASWTKDYRMRGPDGREWTEPMHSHEIQGLRKEDLVFLTVPQGGGVFFTGRTVHGSFANHSEDRPRRAFATHYVKKGTWVFRCDIQGLMPVD